MEEAIRGATQTNLAGATKVLPQKGAAASGHRITSDQVWLLMRRVLVLIAAALYVSTLIDGASKSVQVLFGVTDSSLRYASLRCDLIADYAGSSTIRKSKLIDSFGSTTPHNQTLYLLSKSSVSFESCPQRASYLQGMYSNSFLRSQYSDLVRDASYNISLLQTTELIAPVVDCSSNMVLSGSNTFMRVFYLLRSTTDPDDVYLVTYSFCTQDYRFPDQCQAGVAGVLVLSVVSDMRFQEVDAYHYLLAIAYPFNKSKYTVYELVRITEDGFRQLESVLPPGSTDPTRVIYTSFRTGVYLGTESEQCNIKNTHGFYEKNPVAAMRDWEWRGVTVVRDSWGWVHLMHFAFAADMIFRLVILLLLIVRNLQKGKLWVGDAFVSVSQSVMVRGALVFIGWVINGFWSLMEFCLQDGKVLSNSSQMFIYKEILHADLMVMYISLAGALGFLLRSRIDPALAVFMFEIGFKYRLSIIKWFPAIHDKVVTFSLEDTARGIVAVPPKLAKISPMRFRSTHGLYSKPIDVIFAVLSPILITFAVLICYAIAHKIYRHYFPDRMIRMSRGTDLSTECEAILSWKCSLTMFEVATGAALQNRVGLVSEYDNCVYIKGMKFASADGVYCNGFVVANGKWLMRTTDLLWIVTMLIMRVRFVDVYVYEVKTYTVQKNARLFYPEMLSFRELLQLNTMILA